jgi:hypothetical protein
VGIQTKIDSRGSYQPVSCALGSSGFLQRPCDSFNQEETYCPMVHKDSLRLFLSVSAATNLTIYQANVKTAFLQTSLTEHIYLRSPPGYQSISAYGEVEEILELSSAIYGLQQSSAAFWKARSCTKITKNSCF